MARKSTINKELRKIKTVDKYKAKRAAIKKTITSSRSTEQEKEQAMIKLHSLPRNASPVRVRRRCILTGRPHGYYRKFGLSRNKLREAAMRGDVPGLVKASW